MPEKIDKTQFTSDFLASLGGMERIVEILDEDRRSLDLIWEGDAEIVGRILRAHLVVEHFLGRHIQRRNPNLGDIEDARLTFSQKVSLVEQEPNVVPLLPAIRRLNQVRNRVAHDLKANMTEEDGRVFLSPPMLLGIVKAMEKRMTPAIREPIDCLELFARYAATFFRGEESQFSKLLAEKVPKK